MMVGFMQALEVSQLDAQLTAGGINYRIYPII
jgi:hypothetical protein